MDNKEKRDFLLNEVRKRIIGPGFTEEVYHCSQDSSDEILTNRPQVVYTSGIIFPQADKNNDGQEGEEDTKDSQETDYEAKQENQQTINFTPDDSNTHEDSISKGSFNEESSYEDSLSSQFESNHFNPSHIGLIVCLKKGTEKIDVKLSYGRYKLVEKDKVKDEVHILLNECSIDQIKNTFNYYDKHAKETLNLFGVKSVYDFFEIDENNKWVSPKGIFKVEEGQGGENKSIPLRPSHFPHLLRNRYAFLLNNLLIKKEPIELEGDLTWDDFLIYLNKFNSLTSVRKFLEDNKLGSLEDLLSYDRLENAIKIKPGKIKRLDYKPFLSEILEDDPVKNRLLDKLLQYRFFKREQVEIGPITLEVNGKTNSLDLNDNEDVKLMWKIYHNKKSDTDYLHLLLINKHKLSKKTDSADYIHQAELKILSPNLNPYTEPRHSSINDEEFELNEVLYSDEIFFAKGVNCAATWENSKNPGWVATTYMPQKIVKSFSPDTKTSLFEDACDVYRLTIWSKDSKDEIINRFREIAKEYQKWISEQEQLAANDPTLDMVLQNQRIFLSRLTENIDYLNINEKAFKCFQLANSAMYIQMILGQDINFKNKGRDLSEFSTEATIIGEKAWEYFKENKFQQNNNGNHIKYRPFQLAFLLMNVIGIFEDKSPQRNDIVDLIWFPTGGGKTEAYLALTALTIAHRRMFHPEDNGTSVIMRYTLRLLTAQQFERASLLICSLEFLRNQLKDHKNLKFSLGDNPITIGMWIGKASTPNKYTDLTDFKYQKFFDAIDREKVIPANNPFPISYCPWCGCNLVGEARDGSISKGYNKTSREIKKNGQLYCINPKCHFNSQLPISYIDEHIYDNPPTLLFATVDKFAGLTYKKRGSLFGNDKSKKPDLIIQDELHLISGPLGSIVGMYETLVEELATERNENNEKLRSPKIIGSTATTRNTQNLIKQLYDREVVTFPVSGVRYTDNFFSYVMDEEKSKRLYCGLIPTGHTTAELEIRTIAAMLVAKEKMVRDILIENNIDLNSEKDIMDFLLENEGLKEEIDNYWTLVLYYKDLKTLGRSHSRLSQEILANTDSMRNNLNYYHSLDFILDDFPNRAEEFTSRQDSSKIRQLLNAASESTKIKYEEPSSARIKSKMDIVQATNMISVGIDISRWNVMMMIGQPMTTAEYIQSSSRVGRKYDGLVVNILNPLRNRELSLFENYESYHQIFYKYVEPLSSTSFTEVTLDKLLANLYISHMVLVKDKLKPSDITPTDLKDFKQLLSKRSNSIGTYSGFADYMMDKIDEIHKFFIDKFMNKTFVDILNSQKDNLLDLKEKYNFMYSLRDVESNTYIKYE